MPEERQPEDPVLPEELEPTLEVDELSLTREELEEALREKEQFRTMAQRAQADLINYKRRAAEEREELARAVNSQLILRVLSIADDLGRALALVPEDAVAPGWLEGIQLVERNLDNVLESEGVTKIEAEGRPFEPREHEAISYEETPGSAEGTVVRVIRDGYKLHDKVLRAAQVAVSKPPETEDESNTTQEEA